MYTFNIYISHQYVQLKYINMYNHARPISHRSSYCCDILTVNAKDYVNVIRINLLIISYELEYGCIHSNAYNE